MNIHNHQILIRHSTTSRRSLMKLDPISLVDLVIKWLLDKSCLSPSGDREMILEKYRTMKMNKPFKTKVCDSIEEDYPGGLSWRQYGLLISYQIQSKPTSYNWSGFEIEYSSNTPKPSPPTIQSLCTTLSSSLTLTHAHHLYISNIKFGEDEINVIILTFLPDPPDRLPPSNHTILIIPLLPSNIILITPVPSIFSPYLTAALLSGYGHARKINNLKFTTKNVESAKILALDNASQGVWNRLTNTNHINNVLDNAPEDDHDDVVLGDELDKLNDVSFAGDGYDQFIVPDDEHPYKKRNAQVVDMWANQSLPKLQHLSYDLSIPFDSSNDREEVFECWIGLNGDHVLEGLRQLVMHGLNENGFPSWLGQAPELGRTEDIPINISKDSVNWEFGNLETNIDEVEEEVRDVEEDEMNIA